MATNDSTHRLCSLTTLWSVVGEAHAAEPDAARAAQEQLLARYGGAVRRYLIACLRNADAAEELFQEFALAFLNGNFRNVDPARGRFRDYVKTVLFHLVANHQRRQKPHAVLDADPAQPELTAGEDLDATFLASWREELLSRTWASLATAEADGGPPYATVLRVRADNPDLGSPQLAERLAAVLARPQTAAGVRQTLHRARERFADVLVEEVAQALGDPADDRLEQEFIDLGLYEYCKPAIERREAGD